LFTLKTNPLKRADLDDFVACFNAENRHHRKESERFKPFAYEDLLKRDKISLDIFWLKDESLEDSANMPDPAGCARSIRSDRRRLAAEAGLNSPPSNQFSASSRFRIFDTPKTQLSQCL
jgi:hypothetical protein